VVMLRELGSVAVTAKFLVAGYLVRREQCPHFEMCGQMHRTQMALQLANGYRLGRQMILA
jgi:hypothetical protein